MRLGIFGGAFDPVHLGHLVLAEQCREQCRLDEVWFVPTKIPPHKQNRELAPDADRLEMLRLAIAGRPEFVASEIELRRDDTSWTVDTLREIHQQRSDDELFLLIGADSLRDFPKWRAPAEIAELVTIVAVNRGEHSAAEGSPCSAGKASFSTEHEAALEQAVEQKETGPPALEELTEHLDPQLAEKTLLVKMPGISISATDIRQRVAAGRSIRYLVPRAVEEFIRHESLYRSAEPE